MPWDLMIETKDLFRHDLEVIHVATYPNQNTARWWAVVFANRNSISIRQGQPDEDLIPIGQVIRFTLRETP